MSDLVERGRLAREIIDVARGMNASGINQGTSGNVSARIPGGMLITPSAIPYEEVGTDDLVAMGFDGPRRGSRKPSTEWRLHAGILEARPDARSVLHAHPPYTTALACLRHDIPAFHYMVAVAGGDSIRCAPYATFGTPALARNAVDALDDRRACLLANHGLVAIGDSPRSAMALAIEVEALAAAYFRCLQVGQPALLSADEMAEVLKRFGTYRRGTG